MKIALLFIAAFGLFCTVCAAPAELNDELSGLINRDAVLQDAELQGWLGKLWNKGKNYLKKNGKSLLMRGGRLLSKYDTAEAQRANELAKEQFHFHIYKDEASQLKDRDASQQGDKAKEQFHFHIYKGDNDQLQDKDADQLAKEQFHFHLYNQDQSNQLKDRDTERDQEVAAIESLPQEAQAQYYARLLASLLE